MNKEIRKNILIYLTKEDFKSMALYLKGFSIGEDADEEYFKRVFNIVKDRPYLNGDFNLIKRDFMQILNSFKGLK